jgi:hypothetical protein
MGIATATSVNGRKSMRMLLRDASQAVSANLIILRMSGHCHVSYVNHRPKSALFKPKNR